MEGNSLSGAQAAVVMPYEQNLPKHSTSCSSRMRTPTFITISAVLHPTFLFEAWPLIRHTGATTALSRVHALVHSFTPQSSQPIFTHRPLLQIEQTKEAKL